MIKTWSNIIFFFIRLLFVPYVRRDGGNSSDIYMQKEKNRERGGNNERGRTSERESNRGNRQRQRATEGESNGGREQQKERDRESSWSKRMCNVHLRVNSYACMRLRMRSRLQNMMNREPSALTSTYKTSGSHFIRLYCVFSACIYE